MKIVKKILIGLLVILIAMQCYRPEKNTTETLTQSCFDCHSNHTVYPWYNAVAPVSYWLADHVKDGKKHLNFSDWENYAVKKKDHKLDEVIELIEEKEMPLKEYTWTHEEAQLSEEERQAVITWAKKTRLTYQSMISQE